MKTIILTQNKETLVDDEDYEFLTQWKWYAWRCGRTYYAIRNDYSVKGKPSSVRMHRLLMNPLKGQSIDHLNHDGLDNRRSNLRIVRHLENAMNRNKSIKYTSSFYKGVSKYIRNENVLWRSRIGLYGKKISLGIYTTQVEAAEAYNRKAEELFGEFAELNKIGGEIDE